VRSRRIAGPTFEPAEEGRNSDTAGNRELSRAGEGVVEAAVRAVNDLRLPVLGVLD